jgi:hypothetical protein
MAREEDSDITAIKNIGKRLRRYKVSSGLPVSVVLRS